MLPKKLDIIGAAAWVYIASPLARVGTLLLTYILLTKLPSASYGQYATLLSAVAVLGTLFEFGLPMLVTRSQKSGKGFIIFFRKTLVIKFFQIALIPMLASIVYAFQLVDNFPVFLVLFVNLYLLSFFNLINSLYRHQRFFQIETTLIMLINWLTLIFVALYLNGDGESLLHIAGLLSCATIISLTISSFLFTQISQKMEKHPLKITTGSTEHSENGSYELAETSYALIIKSALALATAIVLDTLTTHFDILMINYFLGAVSVSNYASALFFYKLFSYPFALFATLLFAFARKESGANRKWSSHVEAFWLKFLLTYGVIFLYFSYTIKDYLFLIFPNYSSNAHLLLLMNCMVLVSSLTTLFYAKSIFVFEDKRVLVISTLGLLTNILLNYMLIPKLGITGAAIATLFSHATLCFCYFLYFSRNGGVALTLKKISKYIFISITYMIGITSVSVISKPVVNEFTHLAIITAITLAVCAPCLFKDVKQFARTIITS